MTGRHDAIAVTEVSKAFGKTAVLRQVSLTASAGEVLALLGPSGCGKTTLLRLLAGLERPDAGRIALGERVVAEGRVFVAPEKRGVGLVFQDYALFPQRTVAGNVAFGLRGVARAQRDARVQEVLARVDLAGYGARYPHELSGGQQQRVALARALAPHPQVLLLDEPFSNLDAALRRRLRLELGQLLRGLGVTSVFVTHDQDEALCLADRVAVMAGGRIAQLAAPATVYEAPASMAVARAVGEANFVPGQASGGVVETALGRFAGEGPDGEVQVLFRPEELTVVAEGTAGAATGHVTAVAYLGRSTQLLVEVAGAALTVTVASRGTAAAGDACAVAATCEGSRNWYPAAG